MAQKKLITPILNGEDVVLQASTGAGKTEAVLAPATEKLMIHPDYFTILYIVPTRALALDMNRRIKHIYKKLDLKSGIRTGDGKHFKDAKPHLLIMTPESLDVMMGSQNQDNKYFLKHVGIIIIDEVHVFLHDDRGYQLSYLHRRLARQSIGMLQTIALSATIDNAQDVISFFNLNKSAFYYKQFIDRKLHPFWVHIEDEMRELILLFDDIYRKSNCKKLLMFANSRKKCEQLYDILNKEGVFSKKVFLHYSNLSTKERKFIENSFRNAKIAVCIATSTLELGIDIGDIDGIVLMGPPASSMSFLQRIGRGNRRCQHINLWGICYGQNDGGQLVRFLAFYKLTEEHQIEKCLSLDNYSVLFQQILSCLYAKKILSINSLKLLFEEKSDDLPCIFYNMIANDWLKPTKQKEIYDGGWRYFSSLKKKQIWGNFPPADEEFDVILENEKIAVLPLSMVKQLDVGDHFQLTGKVLKVLRVEEKKAASELLVEKSIEAANKELVWIGLGPLVSFEAAQKMKEVLLDKTKPKGLLNRTSRLLEKEREKIAKSIKQPNGVLVHRLGNGTYRYETFLGSSFNFILYHIIKNQLASKIREFSLNFDEIGLESNELFFFKDLKIPHTEDQIQEWISSHLNLLKAGFSWNSWLQWLPEKYQKKEIFARLYDQRVLEHFYNYTIKTKWHPLPVCHVDTDKSTSFGINLKGNPWTIENEKNVWGKLSFPEISLPEKNLSLTNVSELTASQIQNYVTQKLCPRWARFQQLGYRIKSHVRFSEINQKTHFRQQQGLKFKNKVIKALQNQKKIYFETSQLSLKQAILMAILEKKSFFLVQSKLKVAGLKAAPDLIYIQYHKSYICLEVWDIKFSQSITYAQKWRVAFYSYLLEQLLKDETFSLMVKISPLGGIVCPSIDRENEFKKVPFILSAYKAWMPRLLEKWKIDSESNSSVQKYSMESSCCNCCYFSYCYQETLFSNLAAEKNKTIISRNIESNDFPKNTKHWYFIHYDNEKIRWQCWENGVSIKDVCFNLKDFINEKEFQKETIYQLQKDWIRSIKQEKNPHFIVYYSSDWYFFQKTFHSEELELLWMEHVSWTSIQKVLETHFIWPIDGLINPMQVAVCLGFSDCHPPLSLYHKETFSSSSFDICRQIWNWCVFNIKSKRMVSFELNKENSISLINSYLKIHQREIECRMFDISEFQKNPLSERLKKFRAMGPIRFLGKTKNKGSYQFFIDTISLVSKFRAGDFLKASFVGSEQIQEGFSVILESYLPEKRLLTLRPLSRNANFSRNQLYVLDEDATDWNAPKITRVLNLLKDSKKFTEVIQMLLGHEKSFTSNSIHWIEDWYQSRAYAAGLNFFQKKALMLPFQKKIGLIEGPPGTGKTYLLVWTLIALVAKAKFYKRSIKILITAQTHRAIDQILEKVAAALPLADVFGVCLYKYGQFEEDRFSKLGIRQMQNTDKLFDCSCTILGATGFGVYQLLEDKNFPKVFDWVIFDEASQVLTSYALLSLIFSKGRALFYGDTQQLSPILKGNYENTAFTPLSVLEELISRYGIQNRLRLNETYRMNLDICKFASDHWYDKELQSACSAKDQKLKLVNYPIFKDLLDDYLDPAKSIIVVQLDHFGNLQSSEEEAQWIAKAVKRLICDYSVSPDQIGIISPHRLQNNTIISALKKNLHFSLKLPMVDTVERMQGLEFDIVIFSVTVSDKETIHSQFLKDYRRFNVSLTRARKKIIFVASLFFFQAFPNSERELIAQMPFENLSRLGFYSKSLF
jgi:superfamily II DNA/RNA helicase